MSEYGCYVKVSRGPMAGDFTVRGRRWVVVSGCAGSAGGGRDERGRRGREFPVGFDLRDQMTLPEPRAALLQLASLAVISLLARRRR